MEEMSMRGRRERMTTREEMMEVKLRLGKDEKRAREGGIMLDVKVGEPKKNLFVWDFGPMMYCLQWGES